MRPEGQAGPGDLIRTWWGECREVVSVVSAGDVVEAIVERQIALRTPNLLRDSITATCALYSGATSGHEKQRIRQARARLNRPVRTIKE